MNAIRATSLSLAATITLTVLASINFMATSPAPDALLTTIAGAADQTIVIEAKRERG
jgi:preprotein translocase subunit SecD